VHHDDALGRLTDGAEALCRMSAAALKQVPFRATADRMMTLGDLTDLVAGRVPLVVELKSRFDGDLRLAARAARILADYPRSCRRDVVRSHPIAALRRTAPHLVCGIVAERRYEPPEWSFSQPGATFALPLLLHGWNSRPAFIAYRVDEPHDSAAAHRAAPDRPALLAWTVRSLAQRAMAARLCGSSDLRGFRA